MDGALYKKRPGTSGIRGHLYESKLISLIYFRAVTDERIEEFHLASNMDDIGAFDDICFIAKVKGFERPLAVFIQAKHRENNTFLSLSSICNVAKYFDSYMKIKRLWEPTNKDVLFEGKLNQAECLFVIYTTEKNDPNHTAFEGSYANHLNCLVRTNGIGLRPSYNNKEVDILCKIMLEDKITMLAKKMAQIICDEADYRTLMNDDLVLSYHVILAQNVFNISEIQPEGYRLGTLKNDLNVNEEYVLLFKDTLCIEILRKQDVFYKLAKSVLRASIEIIQIKREMLRNGITFKNGKFDNNSNNTLISHENLVPDNLKVMQMHYKTIQTVMKVISLVEFKIPSGFGNKDLTLKGTESKIEKRMKFLTSIFLDLVDKSQPNNIITVDESVGVGFLQHNGGIASAVGNILVYDTTTKLLKFTDNYESLGKLAKRLYAKLESGIVNMHQYRFDIKVKSSPKLSLDIDAHDVNLVQYFFNSLLFYSHQADENGVEKILKNEIEDYESNDVCSSEVRSDAIFLQYHDEVQKWWKLLKTGPYLTKENNIYMNAVRNARSQPIMSVINRMQELKNIKYKIIFDNNAVKSLKLTHDQRSFVIVTKTNVLTIAKVKQYLENKEHVVLDLEYILNLRANDFNIFCSELRETSRTIIIVCNKVQSSKRFENIANIINEKYKNTVVIISDEKSLAIVKKEIPLSDNVVKDEIYNLLSVTDESRQKILKGAKVLYQGLKMGLHVILDDDTSMSYVEGDVFYKIIRSKINVIGKSISDSNYEKVKHMYMHRSVTVKEIRRTANSWHKRMRTNRFNHRLTETNNLFSISDDVVLITGGPGMGKSTLLSHLSFETKKTFPKVWIIRVNLLKHSKKFYSWQKNNTVINTLESLTFLCQVALSEKHGIPHEILINLEELNGNVYLKDSTGDEWSIFELKMFLDYYNRKKIVFLLDGFDEICPHYANEVLTLIKVMANYPRKHKMWITSRSYETIHSILEIQFGVIYEIDPLSLDAQKSGLHKFWHSELIWKDLNEECINNILHFIMFMSSDKIQRLKKKPVLPIENDIEMPFLIVYISFVHYIQWYLKSRFADVSIVNALHEECDKFNCTFTISSDIVATPLHLYLIAEYVLNQIKDVSRKPNEWYLDTHLTFNIFDRFLETKIKIIRFQEKNQIDMCNPDNILAYEKELAHIMAKHKRLAAYTIFHQYRNQLFDMNELSELKDMIDELKKGEEKTGIICNVVNKIPIFVYTSLGEYFAVEYICDLLKSKNPRKDQEFIWDFVLNVMLFNCNLNVLSIFDSKLKNDEELKLVAVENDKKIFELLLAQSKEVKNEDSEVKSSLCESIRNNLHTFSSLLNSTLVKNLDENNLVYFINMIRETQLLIIAVKMEYENVIATVIDSVRRIDKSKLSLLFENIDSFELDKHVERATTDEIVQTLHATIWTRMNIFPSWDNLSELCGQIYFI